MDRIFDVTALLFLLGFGVAALIIGLIRALAFRDATLRPVSSAFEAATLAVLGGFLARTFVSILLAAGGNSRGAGLAIGWGFFLVPGIVDSIAGIFGAHPLTSPEALLWIAASVGAFTGTMNGLYLIHPWADVKGPPQ